MASGYLGTVARRASGDYIEVHAASCFSCFFHRFFADILCGCRPERGYGFPRRRQRLRAQAVQRFLLPSSAVPTNDRRHDVIINLAVKTITVKKMKVNKKKTTTAIYVEEAGADEMTSAVFWDGKKYRYDPLGSSME